MGEGPCAASTLTLLWEPIQAIRLLVPLLGLASHSQSECRRDPNHTHFLLLRVLLLWA